MEEKDKTTSEENSKKMNFTIKLKDDKYKFTIFNKGDDITFKLENMKDFPVKIYEAKISLKELKEKDECFYGFKNAEKFINNGIKKSIEANKITLNYSEEEKCIILEMRHDIFDTDYVAKIKIPEKEQDLKDQVESLTKIVSKLKAKIKIDENEEEEKKEEILEKEKEKLKNEEKPLNFLTKEDFAINSFIGTSFLQNDEKKLISEFIDPYKKIKFVLLYNNSIDSDSSSLFHYYCDGIFPTVTIILDTSGRRFGGYSTQSWSQSTVGANYSRAPGSFIFNLSQKKKYVLQDQLNTSAVYRHNSYGPTFGGGHDLNIANSCKSNSRSYCNKSSYITGNVNLLGSNGQTNFQVSSYEVYHVTFE